MDKSPIIYRLLATLALLGGCQSTSSANFNFSPEARGIVWQVDNQTLNPTGNWEKLGASELLIQWTSVDDIDFLSGDSRPDWQRIANEPWAKNVIVGLAGYFDEQKARSHAVELIEASRKLASLPTPLNVTGWYFPVEFDPSWTEAAQLAPLLKTLQETLDKPLWISVYESQNIGATNLANWLYSWLPPNVNILFQDGVGLHVRNAKAAREYADTLVSYFGKDRVRIIAEAFRPQAGGGFRPATATEMMPQFATYVGLPIYLFDGPHYVSHDLVIQLITPDNVGIDY